MSLSYFEYSDRHNNSATKFWEIRNTGKSYSVRYGKVGTLGKTKIKELESREACQEKANKEIKAKVAKGYREINLTDIQQLDKLADESLSSILAATELPTVFIEWVADNNSDSYEILKAIASHPQATKPALEIIASSIYDDLIELVELHVNYAGEISEAWSEKVISTIKQTNLYPIRKQVKELARFDLIPNFLLDILELNTRVAVAKNPQTARETLSYLATDWHENVRKAVAQNSSTPREILKQLLSDNAIAVRLAIAKNPDTPSEILNMLADDPYEKVRKALIKNPNIPGDAVFKLRKLLGYSLESYLQKIAKEPTTSPQILAQLAKEDKRQIRNYVAQNLNTPIEILEQLAGDKSPYVRRSAAKNPNSTEEVALKVLFYKHKPKDLVNRKIKPPVAIDIAGKEYYIEATIYVEDENALAAAASHPKLSLNIIEQLIENIEQFLQWEWGIAIVVGIASNLNLPVHTLKWFAGKEYRLLHYDAIYEQTIHQYASFGISKEDSDREAKYQRKKELFLERGTMRSSSDEYALRLIGQVYWGIVQNVATPPDLKQELLEKLTSSKTIIADVSYQIAKSCDTASEILAKLAKVSSRKELAKNPNTPPHVLATLANHKDSDMRKLVAQNPLTPAETLTQLATDKSSCRLNSQKARYFVREAVVSNSNTPVNTLKLLAQDSDEIVRSKVAANPNTPEAILRELASDRTIAYAYQYNNETNYAPPRHRGIPIPPVCLAVAENPNTPQDLLEQLANDENEEVREAAKAQLQSIGQKRGLSIEDEKLEEKTLSLQDLLNTLAKSKSAYTRLVVLLCSDSIEILEKASRSPLWSDRYAVASNPITPINILKQLTQDHNILVRAAAKHYLSDRQVNKET